MIVCIMLGGRVVAEILCYLKVLIKNTPTQVMD